VNPVLARLLAERAQLLEFIDHLLAQVEAAKRDLVDAERANLEAARQRIAELDAQIAPLQEFEDLRGQHQQTTGDVLNPPARDTAGGGDGRRSLGDEQRPFAYRSAGAFLVDYLRGRGIMQDQRGNRLGPDPEAAARVNRAVDNQTTADTPGLLPTPIVGQVVNLIDASRPFVTSLGGAKPMGGIPGKNFERPKITQHTTSGTQTAEKTQLPSRKMKIDPLLFAKETHGGTVDVSRQDIDWTSPAAWDILVNDLADSYAQDSEGAAAAGFAASVVTNTTDVASADLVGWATALYAAAGQCYQGGKRLPDRLWCSVDMWGAMGPLVDTARLLLPNAVNAAETAGSSSLTQFGGYVLDLPRIVVPSFPDGTMIIGRSTVYEVYEETIGLLSVVEPSILGVEVAYGGYVAYGTLEEKAFAKITGPAVTP
jgi:HK97 family phage major capsid protein